MRGPGSGDDCQHHGHDGADRRGGRVYAACTGRGTGRGGRRARPRAAVYGRARILPRAGDSQADERLRHQDGALAAGGSGWNGKFRGTGNGGLGGGAGVNAGQLAAGVRAGYAAAGHNTGHEGDSSYALEHPEKIKDFGYRSAHEMTVASKALIKAFYGTDARLSVHGRRRRRHDCGAQLGQRYPEDYDAIAVTGMSSYLTRHTFGQMWIWQATHKDAASFIPPDKYAVLHSAALDEVRRTRRAQGRHHRRRASTANSIRA